LDKWIPHLRQSRTSEPYNISQKQRNLGGVTTENLYFPEGEREREGLDVTTMLNLITNSKAYGSSQLPYKNTNIK
jgi:hypothetical protein